MGRRLRSRAPDSGHYGVASDGGGRTWATIATLLQTAKMNNVDPFAWLTLTLQRIATSGENLQHELASVSHGGNERRAVTVFGGTGFSRPRHRSASALPPSRSRQGIRIGGTDSLALMIRNFNPSKLF
jgi:hypothetical protein